MIRKSKIEIRKSQAEGGQCSVAGCRSVKEKQLVHEEPDLTPNTQRRRKESTGEERCQKPETREVEVDSRDGISIVEFGVGAGD
jgi:hypothetical protein